MICSSRSKSVGVDEGVIVGDMVGSVEGEEDGTAVGAGDSEGLEVGDPVTIGRKLTVRESFWPAHQKV